MNKYEIMYNSASDTEKREMINDLLKTTRYKEVGDKVLFRMLEFLTEQTKEQIQYIEALENSWY